MGLGDDFGKHVEEVRERFRFHTTDRIDVPRWT